MKSFEFGITNAKSILRNSVVHVTDSRCAIDEVPVPNGLRDPRFGVISGSEKCKTCSKNRHGCSGHWGHIVLSKPVYHIAWVNHTIHWLRSICHKCNHLLWRTEGTLQQKASKVPSKCPKCKAKLFKYMWDKDKASVLCNKKRYTAEKALKHLKGYAEDLILTVFPVPPLHIRPPLIVGSKTKGENDLTYRLQAIIRANKDLSKKINKQQPNIVIMHALEKLQNCITGYINHKKLGDNRQRKSQREYTSVSERLSRKEGRIRGNIMGKRVDFSARTVITPSDFIHPGEVGVPVLMSKILTIPVKVTDYNRKALQDMVSNGKVRYVKKPDGSRIDTSLSKNVNIDVGYIVDRHLQDGDIVLFNRQPSLHKMSMMAHRAKILEGSSFRLNASCTTPYNADFDGDEMNLHVCQTIEARAEASEIMAVKYQIVSPQSNKPVISLIQDSLVGAWLLSGDTLDPDDFQRCTEYKTGTTGHELLSTIMPKLNYSRGDVVIKDGKVLSGRFNKKILGSSDGSLIHVMYNECGPQTTIDFIHKLQKLVHTYLSIRGFTVSIGDMIPEQKVIDLCQEELEKAMIDVKGETEDKINQRLNSCRATMGKIAVDPLEYDNNFLCMVESGSKGSLTNLTQVMGCLGQQNVKGKRPENHYTDRTLPHYKRGEFCPESKGFIASSYIKGLTPPELWFHSQSGREGLIDTAIKTATTGYLERRIMKALENIRSDRGSAKDGGLMISFLYGEDGYDAMFVERQKWRRFDLSQSNTEEYKQWIEDCKLLESVGKDPSIDKSDFFYLPIPIQRIIDRYEAGTPLVDDAFPIVMDITRDLPDLLGAFVRVHLLTDRLRSLGVTHDTFELIIEDVKNAADKCKITHGESVGAIAAQSIGERCTQLTLNTFHSSGDSSKNVTLGIPRMQEILNCSKRLSAPIVRFKDIASGLEKHVTFGDILMSEGCILPEDQEPLNYFWTFPDPSDVEYFPQGGDVRFEFYPLMDVESLRAAFERLGVYCAYTEGPKVLCHVYGDLPNNWKNETVCGVKGCSYVERDGDILETPYIDINSLFEMDIDVTTIQTNDIHKMARFFGIEAARQMIIEEVRSVLKYYGIYINVRHLTTLADYMTWNGSLTPLTRHGFKHMVKSPLKKCTFEEVVDVLHTAAVFGQKDNLEGISECILTGVVSNMGSNCVTVMKDKVVEATYRKDPPEDMDIDDPFAEIGSWIPEAMDTGFVKETPLYKTSPKYCPPSPKYCPSSPKYYPSSPV